MDLKGVRILLVEDSWYLGMALRNQLRALGADVAGPCATAAEAERLISERAPDAALVDYNLRGGERADSLIDQLHDQGVRVIVTLRLRRSSAVAGKGRGHPAKAYRRGAAYRGLAPGDCAEGGSVTSSPS